MLIVYLTLTGSFLTLLLIVLIIIKGYTRRNEPNKEPKQILTRPISSDLPNKARKRRVRQRVEQSRINEEEEFDDEDNEIIKMQTLPVVEGKIGTKKAKKLEKKEEKRAMRIQAEEEREERRKKQAIMEEKRRLAEEKRELEEKEREEAEERAKEEKERQEHEEYLKMKAEFELEEEGYEENFEDLTQNKLQGFIEFIKEKKVVLLEDLAANFMMKTQDAIDRLNQLLEDEQITGIIDDRGKFIYITEEELFEIAKFIKKRGRVSISELVENSNNLINVHSQC